MYELVQVAENTYYINSPSKMGVYRVSDDDVWLIDSGNDQRRRQKSAENSGSTRLETDSYHQYPFQC